MAGDGHHPPRQLHRAGADGAERACRHEVRRVVPGAVPRELRRARRERAGNAAGAGRLRLVRDSDLDRRPRARHPAGRGLARLARAGRGRRVGRVRGVLAGAGRHHHSRPRRHQEARELVGAAAAGRRRAAAVWAVRRGGGLGHILSESSRLQTAHLPFWQLFPGRADRQRRLLGDAQPEHPRLHPLRPQPAFAGARPGAWACRRR